MPRDRTVRAQDVHAPPGVINPPIAGARIRRQGPGAEYLAPRADDDYLQLFSYMQAELGAKFFDPPEPELAEAAPAAIGDPGELHGIAVLASALHRRTHTIRDWERRGVIPPSATRTEGHHHQGGLATTTTTSARRLYTTEEIEAAAQIAADEGLLLGRGQHVDISSSEFTERVSAAWQRLRAGAK